MLDAGGVVPDAGIRALSPGKVCVAAARRLLVMTSSARAPGDCGGRLLQCAYGIGVAVGYMSVTQRFAAASTGGGGDR